MKIGHYKQGLGDSGIRMFDNLREKHALREDKDLLLLRILAESWETMVNSREMINDPDFEGPKPYTINKEAKQQLMSALRQLWYIMN